VCIALSIEDSSLDGIRCYRSVFDIRLNEIRESGRNGVFSDSVAAESDDSVYIVDNELINASAGVTSSGINVRSYVRYRVSANTIKRFRVGIDCQNCSSALLVSNTIDSCEYYGLLCGSSSSPLVRSNTIKHVMYGARASGNSYPDLGHTSQTGDGNNSIYITSSYRVLNANTGPAVGWIKAENNWWGNASPDSSWFGGLVNWIPYLQYDPNQSKLIAESQRGLPEVFTLYQNYPNPFNPTTVVEYDVPKATQVLIEVYNLLGRKVATLRDAHEEPGHKVIRWDGRGDSGSVVATGVYFCSMKAGETRQVRKMVVIK
jgi:parallel beta-helix repeat protein